MSRPCGDVLVDRAAAPDDVDLSAEDAGYAELVAGAADSLGTTSITRSAEDAGYAELVAGVAALGKTLSPGGAAPSDLPFRVFRCSADDFLRDSPAGGARACAVFRNRNGLLDTVFGAERPPSRGGA